MCVVMMRREEEGMGKTSAIYTFLTASDSAVSEPVWLPLRTKAASESAIRQMCMVYEVVKGAPNATESRHGHH